MILSHTSYWRTTSGVVGLIGVCALAGFLDPMPRKLRPWLILPSGVTWILAGLAGILFAWANLGPDSSLHSHLATLLRDDRTRLALPCDANPGGAALAAAAAR